jgi:peptidoglycan/xylan/chitin deacetylase (PgdA/CDA1 family)
MPPQSKTLRRIARDLVARLLHVAGLTRLGRSSGDCLTIVTFHRVLPEHQIRDYPIRAIAVTPSELAWFLDRLADAFTLTTLQEAAEQWQGRAGGKPPLAVTFDDGQLDNFVHARPVLDRASVRATFFVTTSAAESGELLWHDRMAYVAVLLDASTKPEAVELLRRALPVGTPDSASTFSTRARAARAVEQAKLWPSSARWDWIEQAERLVGRGTPEWDGMMSGKELQALAETGHEIGCHSRSHEILPLLDDAALEREIVQAGQRMAELSGRPCVSFCYPNGDHDRRCLDLVRRHYRWGVTVAPGFNKRDADPAALRRFDMVADNARTFLGSLSVPLLAWRMRTFALRSEA